MGLDELLIESGPSKRKDADRIRKHAEGLAREIQSDVMAKEDEIADAIEAAIRRFSGRCIYVKGVSRCVKHKHHESRSHLANNGKRWQTSSPRSGSTR